MDEDMDTSKELVIFQSKIYLLAIIVLDLLFGYVLLIIPFNSGRNRLNSLNDVLFDLGIFIVLLVIFLLICRQLFIKSPLLRVNDKGFFTRKTGDVLWDDIENITMFAGAAGGSSLIVFDFKNGKKININPTNMRLPSEGAFTVNRGFEVLRVLNAYKKTSDSNFQN